MARVPAALQPENLLLCRPEDCPAEEVAGGRPSGGGGSGSGGGGWLCKLADFGVSVDLNRERAVTRAGTGGACSGGPQGGGGRGEGGCLGAVMACREGGQWLRCSASARVAMRCPLALNL